MSRSADYTIQGFIYQFNKTLLEVLEDKDESEITVEGIIEDIEVKSVMVTKTIQCKYHESQEKFTLGYIYKPILQMMTHHLENSNVNTEYKLFAHFPNEESGSKRIITNADISEILKSKNKNFNKYILKLKNSTKTADFLSKFTLEFGPSLDDLVTKVGLSLISNGMPKDDIDTLIYPNAIQRMADLSILHDPSKRVIRKEDLLQDLLKIKKTAITRWTTELKTLDKLLKSRRIQLRGNLAKNSRSRYFIISDKSIENFNEVIVTFISEYLNKYHFKDIHDKTPLFCLDCSWETFRNILVRLHKKQIRANTGLLADFFDKSLFNDGPYRHKKAREQYTEFKIRLLHYENEEAINILNETKSEELFIFMKSLPDGLDKEDVNIELIDLNEIEKIKYVMGMCDVYE